MTGGRIVSIFSSPETHAGDAARRLRSLADRCERGEIEGITVLWQDQEGMEGRTLFGSTWNAIAACEMHKRTLLEATDVL